MWLSENQNQNPFMTVVGSSNYSMWSYKRDSECNFFIYSECEDFRAKLKEEVDYLFSNSTKVSYESLRNDKEMKLGMVKKFFFEHKLKSFLYFSISSWGTFEPSLSSSNFASFDQIWVPIVLYDFHDSLWISNEVQLALSLLPLVHSLSTAINIICALKPLNSLFVHLYEVDLRFVYKLRVGLVHLLSCCCLVKRAVEFTEVVSPVEWGSFVLPWAV